MTRSRYGCGVRRRAVRWLLFVVAACGIATARMYPAAHQAGAGVSIGATGTVGADRRIRVVRYSADRVYRLRGYVGYEIDLQFALRERVRGIGVGDAKGITFGAAKNNLFIKPRAAHVSTNLTVLTNRRTYLFAYTAGPAPAGRGIHDAVYAMRFEYTHVRAQRRVLAARRARVNEALGAAAKLAPRNYDYWYCGASSLKPVAAWDDGVETHLTFGARADLPAVFVRNADGSDSLVNFNVESGTMIVQRVAKRFILRRGILTGCVVNEAFAGSGRRLASGTLSPDVLRALRHAPNSLRKRIGRGGLPGEGWRP